MIRDLELNAGFAFVESTLGAVKRFAIPFESFPMNPTALASLDAGR